MIGISKGDYTKNVDSNDEDEYRQDISIPKYFVTTLFAPANPVKYFDNQEVIIPTQILVSDNDILTRVNASPSEKLQLLTMYKNIINTYRLSSNINILGDYQAVLKEQADKDRMIKVKKNY